MTITNLEPVLEIQDLHVSVGDKEILKGISLTVLEGEKIAIMGPNGSGKSTLSSVILGKPGYAVTQGQIVFAGYDISKMPAFERARLGLALISQYPQEVEGVDLYDLVVASLDARGMNEIDIRGKIFTEAEGIGFATSLLDRWINVDLSGGEKKRFETLLLSLVPSKLAILDEIDSGLDIDALRHVSHRIDSLSIEKAMAVVAITHYSRLLRELTVERVLVLAHGEFVAEGGPELAENLERTGYKEYASLEVEAQFPF